MSICIRTPNSISKHNTIIDTFNNNEYVDLSANILNDYDYISAIPVLKIQRVLPYVFTNLNDHILSQELFNNHKKQLVVCITDYYINIRFHHLGNTYNKEQKKRHKLTMLILFN
ncbi:hypothetical protein PUN28_010866 [Cardiocondyla obscurior]|uniref:Uncharacterized protein n=1 Tax=Cardiocondyla obscurior TaxID=286306 RepID=A0AAW2FI55_9HYME